MRKFSIAVLLFIYTLMVSPFIKAQNYDTSRVKPSRTQRKQAHKEIDSLSKTVNKSESDNVHHKKKESPVYFYRQHNGTLELHYTFGESIAVVFIYNDAADTLARFELTGSGKKVIERQMVGDKIYFYDLYISGKFIETKKLTYTEASYSTKEQRNRENALNAPPP